MEINQEFLDKYNPSGARELSKEEVAAMKDFTPEMIRALATAHPNTKTGATGYLVLGDKRLAPEKQIHPFSTWQNLDALYRQGEKSYYPETFKVLHTGKKKALAVAPLQDLTKKELENAEGLKSAKTQDGKEGKTSSLSKSLEQQAKEVVEPTFEDLMKLKKDELIEKYVEKFEVDPGKVTKEAISNALVSGEMIPG